MAGLKDKILETIDAQVRNSVDSFLQDCIGRIALGVIEQLRQYDKVYTLKHGSSLNLKDRFHFSDNLQRDISNDLNNRMQNFYENLMREFDKRDLDVETRLKEMVSL